MKASSMNYIKAWAKFLGLSIITFIIIAWVIMPELPKVIWQYARLKFFAGSSDQVKNGLVKLQGDLKRAGDNATNVKPGDNG